jgi:hypothetical protein
MGRETSIRALYSLNDHDEKLPFPLAQKRSSLNDWIECTTAVLIMLTWALFLPV